MLTSGYTSTEEMDLLLAALDTAREGSLYDVLFCLKCILAPYILRCVCLACLCLYSPSHSLFPNTNHHQHH